ncbi:hypothetical protein HMPREF0682_1141, partial [Propionibacterium acidifaciens F0233]
MAGVAGSYGLVVRAVGGRVAGWRGEYPGLGADAVTAEERAEIKRLRAEFRGARVGDGFLEGAVVFFARGSGWAWDAAASAAEEATASSGPCAGGWRYPGPAAAPGGAVPGPRRPGGGGPGGRHRRVLRRVSERAHRLPPGPRGAGPERRRGLSLGVVRGIVVAAGPVARRPRGRAGTDRAGAGSSGPAG